MEYGVSVKMIVVGFYEEFKHVFVATSSQRCCPLFVLILKNYYLMCLNVLPVYMYVHHMCVWCPQRPWIPWN